MTKKVDGVAPVQKDNVTHAPARPLAKRLLQKGIIEPLRTARNYLFAGMIAVTLTFSCAGKPVQVASLGDYFPTAEPAKTTKPSPKSKDQKIAPEEKKQEEKKEEKKKTIEYIAISKLEEYRADFIKKQKETYGSDVKISDAGYEEVTNAEFRFIAEATTNGHPLFINGEKRALVISAAISKDKERLEKGGIEAGAVYIGIFDTSTKLLTGAVLRNLDDLIADYKEKHDGQYPPAIHLVVEMGIDEKVGEYYQARAIAASSASKVEKGEIEGNMPVVWISHVAATGDDYTNESLMAYTTTSKQTSKKIVAKSE